MVYDGLLVLAVLMIVTACFLPFTGGEAVTWDRAPLLALQYWAALVVAILAYFGLPWTQRGQTLGMATWRLRVQRDDGFLLTWRDVAVRLGASVLSWLPAGLGWVWALFDRERRTWHDSAFAVAGRCVAEGAEGGEVTGVRSGSFSESRKADTRFGK